MAKPENKRAEDGARKMPSWFFSGALEIDYPTAIKADVSQQNYSMSARGYYVDARFECEDCRRGFLWSAQEQRFWFEKLGFYIDSRPTRCRACRSRRRRIKRLQQEYDQVVGAARSSGVTDDMIRVIGIVDYLESLGSLMAEKMLRTRDEFRARCYDPTPHNKTAQDNRGGG